MREVRMVVMLPAVNQVEVQQIDVRRDRACHAGGDEQAPGYRVARPSHMRKNGNDVARRQMPDDHRAPCGRNTSLQLILAVACINTNKVATAPTVMAIPVSPLKKNA